MIFLRVSPHPRLLVPMSWPLRSGAAATADANSLAAKPLRSRTYKGLGHDYRQMLSWQLRRKGTMASISTGAEEVGVPRKIKFENDASSVAEPTTAVSYTHLTLPTICSV